MHNSTKTSPNSKKVLTRIRIHHNTHKNIPSAGKINRKNISAQVKPQFLSRLQKQPKSLEDNPSHRLPHPLTVALRTEKREETKDTRTKSELPNITQNRVGSDWGGRLRSKLTEPTRSMKIPFKELIPVREVSKEEKLANFRKIRDEFRQVVNASNFVSVKNKETVFRAYVEKGNNGILIKQLLKKRWWWHLQDQPSKANLLWTEWFNKGFVGLMSAENCRSRNISDYSPVQGMEQPKVTSVRRLLDESTFSKYRPRISLADDTYFRSRTQKAGTELKEIQSVSSATIHNHIDGCLQLHSKKLLFKNLYSYLKSKEIDPFEVMPVTFYIDEPNSPALEELYSYCSRQENEEKSKNMWLVKPGQNSNRGYGISVHAGLQSLKKQIQTRLSSGRCSMIVQRYIENCLLIENRKCDIRCYILITTVNGILKGYWYGDGYLRTSSVQYSLEDVDNLLIHLTNDAVQKNNDSYGKFQDFNKMSFLSFRKYLLRLGYAPNAFENAYQTMKNIAYQLIVATADKLHRKQYTFELFGLDFMLDRQLKPYLIEANSNPCLDNSGVILGKLIYELVDNVLMTAVDPLFPAPTKGKFKEYLSKDYFRSNKFELIYTDIPSE